MSTVLNRANTKRYALKVGAERRAGKFTRVGVSFMERCEAQLECVIRAISNNGTCNEQGPSYEGCFITATARSKAEEMLEARAQRIIFTEVMKHPSMGKTLK